VALVKEGGGIRGSSQILRLVGFVAIWGMEAVGGNSSSIAAERVNRKYQHQERMELRLEFRGNVGKIILKSGTSICS